MKFYIAKDGKPAGPFTVDEMLQHGLDAKTLVWNDTLVGWTKAGKVPELAQRLNGGVEPVVEENIVQTAAPTATGSPESAYAPQEEQEETRIAPSQAQSPYAPQQSASAYAPQQPETPPVFVKPQEPQPQRNQEYNQPNYAQPQYEPQPQPQPQQAPPQPQYGQQPYAPRQPYAGMVPETNKTMAIVALVLSIMCCCNFVGTILAVISLVKGSNAMNAFKSNDLMTAEIEAKSARSLAMAALIVTVVLPILFGIFAGVNPELHDAFMQGYNEGLNGG